MEPAWEDYSEPMARRRLVVEEDLSHTCRLDSYCTMCVHAFCSHCCYMHHPRKHCTVIPVGVDAAGQPTFPDRHPVSGWPLSDRAISGILENNNATALTMDAYCLRCARAFCTGACKHHHIYCGRGLIVRRIEERQGRYYVRCRGDEKWFARVECVLGDPVVGEDYGELMLLPLPTRERGTCAWCHGPVPCPSWQRCSPACAARHDLEIAQRRERRDAMRAARQLAKLNVQLACIV